MASPESAGGATPGVLVAFVIVILLVARRFYRNAKGARVSTARILGYTAFYFVFGALFVTASFSEGVPYVYGLADAVLLLAGAAAAYKLAEKRLSFWRSADGSIMLKGAMAVYAIYAVGLAVRLGIELVLVGPSAFVFTSSTSMTPTAMLGTTAADLLLTFGIGLLVGRNARVYGDYRKVVKGELATPVAAP